MAKVKLGKRPTHIHRPARGLMPDGTEGVIQMSYLYRTRTEFGEFIDARLADARAKAEQQAQADADALAEGDTVKAFTSSDLQTVTVDTNAEYILAIADGWDLDEPFNAANVTTLCNELPGMARAITDGYREAVTEGRLGN